MAPFSLYRACNLFWRGYTKLILNETTGGNTMQLKVSEIKDLILSAKGKFFTVGFVKKSGEKRVMNARTGVVKYLRGGASTTAHKTNLMTVFDMKSAGYRCINMETLYYLKVNGKEYNIESVVNDLEEKV